MLSLGLSCLVFLFLTLAGRATLSLFNYRRSHLRAWLLSPALGLALLLLGLMIINQAGLPIRRFAWAWTLAIAVFSGLMLAWRRPLFPWRSLRWLGLIGLFSLLWTGWPALHYGFGWVSYSNDDMANYCLAAERFADRGFFTVPSSTELNLTDYTQNYWYMHASDLMRFGSEHLLSWTASLTGLKATQIFMPVIVMLSLLQLSSAAGLVLSRGRHRRWALATAGLLALSPLFMLGTLYQLIAQVGGLALLMTLLSLLTERPSNATGALFRQGVLAGISAGALCIYYPEVTPFAGLGFGCHLFLSLLRDKGRREAWLRLSVYCVFVTFVYINFNAISYIYTFLKQFVSAVRTNDLSLSLFPYFLLPSGFGNLYGWMPFTHLFSDPVPLISVIAGMCLSLLAITSSVREAWRRTPIAILFCVMAALAVKLFTGGNDFGLYKLAMFIQPPLMAALAWWLLRLPSRGRVAVWLVALYFASTIPTALSYSTDSLGLRTGSITELPFASELGLTPPFPKDLPKPSRIRCTVENVVAAKFAGGELRGHEVTFPARDFFTTLLANGKQEFRRLHPHFGEISQSDRLEHERDSQYLHGETLWGTGFLVPSETAKAEYLLYSAPRLSLYNKLGRQLERIPPNLFEFRRLSEVHNHLFFIHSNRGNHYYLGDRRRIAIFQMEPDPFVEGEMFAGMGQFMLMRVENPSEEIYLRLALTRTLVPGHKDWSSQGVVHGEKDLPLPLGGHGAINRIIGPLRPLRIGNVSYVAIDFMETPQILKDRRHGIMSLYNREVPLDFRRLICWGRDISALSPEEYEHLQRPLSVSRFPDDIVRAEGLEFSGVDEDGWLAPVSEWILGPSQENGYIRLRGEVPPLPGAGGSASVQVNGAAPVPASLAPGVFDLRIPVSTSAQATRIRLDLGTGTLLPGSDGRRVGALLRQLSVEPAETSWTCDYTRPDGPRYPVQGADQDGWLAARAALLLPGSGGLRLRIECPGWQDQNGITLSITRADGTKETHTLHSGANELSLSASPDTAPQLVSLAFDREFQLPQPDGRQRSVRLLSLEPLSATQPRQ